MKTKFSLFFLMLLGFITPTHAEAFQFNYDNQNSYIGCWSGMNGGKLKITANKIYDLCSKENSPHKEKVLAKRKVNGLQTGEEFLLELKNDYAKSFLAKWISFSFNSDGTVGITTYDSYNDYLNNNLVG